MSPAQAATETGTNDRAEVMVVIFRDVAHFPLDGAILVFGNHGSGCESFRHKNHRYTCEYPAEHIQS